MLKNIEPLRLSGREYQGEWLWDGVSQSIASVETGVSVNVRLIRMNEDGTRFYSYKYAGPSGVVQFAHIEWEVISS